MKTLHFASILVLASSVTFVACDDDEDRVTPGAAGASGAAGENSSAGSNGSAGKNGTAGSGAAGSGTAGAGGSPTDAGASGVSEGGLGGEGLGGEAGSAGAGSLGGAGGEGGAGGAPEVPDVLVPGPTELVGTWSNNYGGTEVVTANTWNGANIVAYTSGVAIFYTHNVANDPYNPKKFSKWVYTQPVNDAFYYCQVVFGAATLAAAQADTTVPDASNPDTGGCGGSFPWTKATKQ